VRPDGEGGYRARIEARRESRRWARWIGVAFLLSAGASIGLTVVYWQGGQPQVEGLLIGVALGGLAFGFVLWSRHLMPEGPYVEERPAMTSTEEEREQFAADFYRDEEGIKRRTFIGRMLLLALGALGAAAVFPIRSLGPRPGRSLFQTWWRPGSRVVTPDNLPVKSSDLNVGSILTVFPEGHSDAADSQTVLIRVDPSQLHVLPGRESWTPDGFVAYSKICTHAGCPVGLYEQRSGRLFCPCHQSVFDVLNGAEPQSGPATRPLPQLPLEVDAEGYLRAQADYDRPVGPAFWNDGAQT
jgi:ubiquinol-cytochrome c reductase iron-sulfur subunit